MSCKRNWNIPAKRIAARTAPASSTPLPPGRGSASASPSTSAIILPTAPRFRTGRPDRAHARALLRQGWKQVCANPRALCGDFWRRSDVKITGDLRVQQSLRWNLFQLLQASARVEGAGIGARGLTGQTYEGTLLLGYGNLCAAVSDLHGAAHRRQPAALPPQHAAGRAPARPAGGREGRAVSLAHHQRRGGLGLLCRGHRPVSHQCRYRARHPQICAK
jgi:hypothetical protein